MAESRILREQPGSGARRQAWQQHAIAMVLAMNPRCMKWQAMRPIPSACARRAIRMSQAALITKLRQVAPEPFLS